MTPILTLILIATTAATAFLSGIFGMAGGMVLMGVLLVALPVPEAMAFHAITQLASNGWRGLLWIKFVDWRAAGFFLLGSAAAILIWSFILFVPPKPVAFLLLGLAPFAVSILPESFKPDPHRLSHGLTYGSSCMSLMLLTGVAGPLIDTYFLGGGMDRRRIIATKAACQVFGHAAKFLYFGMLINQGASISPMLATMAIIASFAGTMLAKPVLEMLSDGQYRQWTARIVTTIALFYLAHAGYLFLHTQA